MMIQIEPKCPMGCAHCGLGATMKGFGTFTKSMSTKIFKAALNLAEDFGTYITLGGAEPTLHPDFEKFLMLAVSVNSNEGGVHIITSGCHKERALLLSRLAKKGVICAELSQDRYHPKNLVHPEVVEAFTKKKTLNRGYGEPHDSDYREIRTVSTIIPIGRGAELSESDENAGCLCDDLIVQPDGTLKWCGCTDSPIIGHVLTGFADGWEDVWSQHANEGCWHDVPEEIKEAA